MAVTLRAVIQASRDLRPPVRKLFGLPLAVMRRGGSPIWRRGGASPENARRTRRQHRSGTPQPALQLAGITRGTQTGAEDCCLPGRHGVHVRRPFPRCKNSNPTEVIVHVLRNRFAACRAGSERRRARRPEDLRGSGLRMETLDPHTVQALCATVAAAAMIVLGRAKGRLEMSPVKRCASCQRLLAAGRRCPQCG